MRAQLKLIPAMLLALLLLLAVACNGGGSDDSSSNQPADGGSDNSASNQNADGAASDELVLSGAETLGRSAADFQQQVTSLKGRMAMDMSMGEMSMGFGGDFAFQSPDRMHMTMEFSGGDDTLIDLSEFGSMEMMVVGEDIYIKMAFLGDKWVKANLDDLGVDAEQFRELLNDQSPFDYSSLIEGLGEDVQVQDLGVEDLNGHIVQHYRVSSDVGALMEALSGALGDDLSGTSFPVDEVSGPIVMDLWLEQGTLLPYKMTAKGSFVVDEGLPEDAPGTFSINMSIDIDEYNGAVTFPDPPTDAIDFTDLGDEMFGDPIEAE